MRVCAPSQKAVPQPCTQEKLLKRSSEKDASLKSLPPSSLHSGMSKWHAVIHSAIPRYPHRLLDEELLFPLCLFCFTLGRTVRLPTTVPLRYYRTGKSAKLRNLRQKGDPRFMTLQFRTEACIILPKHTSSSLPKHAWVCRMRL